MKGVNFLERQGYRRIKEFAENPIVRSACRSNTMHMMLSWSGAGDAPGVKVACILKDALERGAVAPTFCQFAEARSAAAVDPELLNRDFERDTCSCTHCMVGVEYLFPHSTVWEK